MQIYCKRVMCYSTFNNLQMLGSSVLDITNNAALINYYGDDPYPQLQGDVAAAYAGGAWIMRGITSTTAAGGITHGVAVVDGADNIVAGLQSGQVLIEYALYGDANLSGVVTISDFNLLAAKFGAPVLGWDQGDFNYNYVVTIADFNALAANFGVTSVVQPLPAPGVRFNNAAEQSVADEVLAAGKPIAAPIPPIVAPAPPARPTAIFSSVRVTPTAPTVLVNQDIVTGRKTAAPLKGNSSIFA